MNHRKLDEPAPLILTAVLDERSQALFNELREAYFPPERNVLDAHVTLFHALPGAFESQVRAALAPLAGGCAPLRFTAPAPYSLGQGVAILIHCLELERVRREFRTRLEALPALELTAQDKAKRKLHVTVQNKVSPQDARRTLQGISMAWNPEMQGQVLGLALWRYVGGPWEPIARYDFARPAA